MSRWRLIRSGAGGAALNMALDEAIAHSVHTGNCPPTLRLYGWSSPSISLGVFQSINEIHRDFCAALGIAVVRRPTGGRAILHGDEITYSFSARNKGPFSGGLYPSFYALSRAFSAAFRLLGLPVAMKKHPARGAELAGSTRCFESVSYGELTVQGKKIIGSAQKRWPEGFLQQGCIPLSPDIDQETQAFRQHSDDNGRSGLRHYLPAVTTAQIEAALIAGFEAEFRVQLVAAQPFPEELALAERLAAEKYQAAGWTESRGRAPRSLSNSETAPSP